MDRLHDELMAVSHPDSAQRRKYWTPEEIREFFRPSKETHYIIKTWLAEAGFGKERITVSPGDNWLEVLMTVAEAEKVSRFLLLFSSTLFNAWARSS
jgi:tripeptidyl-peptidase-1